MRRLLLLAMAAALIAGCGKGKKGKSPEKQPPSGEKTGSAKPSPATRPGMPAVPAATQPATPADRSLSDQQLKDLISRAAAMSTEVFLALTEKGGMPDAAAAENQTLTLVLLGLRIDPLQDAAALGEFHFLEATTPAALAGALTGGNGRQASYVSVLRPENITRCTRDVQGDHLAGTVSFRAANVYEGTVDYAARWTPAGWQVDEFRLVRHGLRVVREAAGTWKMLDDKPYLRLAIDPPRVPARLDSEALAPCRVILGFSTLRPAAEPAPAPTSLLVSLRPTGVRSESCTFELTGHPAVLYTARELRQVLAVRAKLAGGELPPVLLRARGDVRWSHIVAACRAAELAGFADISLDQIAAQMKLSLAGQGLAPAQTRPAAQRVVVRIPAIRDTGLAAERLLGSEAEAYWLGDKRYSPSETDDLGKALAAELAEADDKGFPRLEVEIRADAGLAWSQIEEILDELAQSPQPATQPAVPATQPAAPATQPAPAATRPAAPATQPALPAPEPEPNEDAMP